MKTSIYVPDELWEKVTAAQPDASASQLFQECLRARFEHPARPSYAQLSPRLVAQRDAVHKALLPTVAMSYQLGYSIGLALVEELGLVIENEDGLTEYEAFTLLAASDFNLDEFAAQLQSRELDDNLGQWWYDAVQPVSELFARDDWSDLPKTVVEGATDAMRDAWLVASGQQELPEGPADAGTPGQASGQE